MDSRETAVSFTSWADFFAAYDAAHQNPVNRWIHHLAHLGAAAGIGLLATHPLAGAALVLGAFPANWAGHRLFEGNTPAFLAASDPWGKAQVALGGLAWTATTLSGDLQRLLARA
jgi:hypothetical protein